MKPNRAGTTRTRRSFLGAIGRTAAGAGLAAGVASRVSGGAPQAIRGKLGPARPRPDLLGKDSPAGLEVIQLTTEPDVPGTHVYMEAQVFTPDSKRFVL